MYPSWSRVIKCNSSRAQRRSACKIIICQTLAPRIATRKVCRSINNNAQSQQHKNATCTHGGRFGVPWRRRRFGHRFAERFGRTSILLRKGRQTECLVCASPKCAYIIQIAAGGWTTCVCMHKYTQHTHTYSIGCAFGCAR